MTKKQKTRVNTKTALSLAPLSVDEALEALLKTAPPDKGVTPKVARKGARKRKGR